MDFDWDEDDEDLSEEECMTRKLTLNEIKTQILIDLSPYLHDVDGIMARLVARTQGNVKVQSRAPLVVTVELKNEVFKIVNALHRKIFDL